MSDVDLAVEVAELGYELVRPLAKGGMGAVFQVRHAGSNRAFVLKLAHADVEEGSEIAKRTVAEGRVLRALRHPNIVELLDAGLTRSRRPYLLMELLEGRTLKQEVDHRGPLPAAEVVDVLSQVLSGLDAAHARGLVHRDLKPPNLFYLEEHVRSEFFPGTHRRVKILDFGIAKATSEAAQAAAGSKLVRTREGYFLGSPNFIAPEQALGSAVTGSADVYSMGAVAFYLLTGRPPFKGLSIELVLQQHLTAQPVAPSSLIEGVPRALDEVILRALAKRPEDRFRTALQMQRALFDVASALVPPPLTRTVRLAPREEGRQEDADTIEDLVAVRPSGADEDTARHEVPAEPAQAASPAARVRVPERAPPRRSVSSHRGAARARDLVQIESAWVRPALWIALGVLTAVVLILVAVLLRLPERMLRTNFGPSAPAAGVWSVGRSGDSGMFMESALKTIPQALSKRLTSSAFRGHAHDTEPSVLARDAHVALPSPEEIARYAKPREPAEPALPPHARFELIREGKGLMQDFGVGETFRGVVMGRFYAAGGMAYLYEGTHSTGAPVLVKVLQEKYRHPAFARVQQKLHAEGELGLHASRLAYLAKVYEVGRTAASVRSS